MNKSKTRIKLSKIYGENCHYCGLSMPLKEFCIDHVIPQKLKVINHISNLRLCCRPCNASKSANNIEQFRLTKRVIKSIYKGVINPNQYLKLKELGVDISLPEHSFWFEVKANDK